MPDFPLSLDLMALKATLILIGAMLMAFVLRRASGSSRHMLWTATTVALLALPVLESQLPQWSVPWLPSEQMPEPAVSPALSAQWSIASVGGGVALVPDVLPAVSSASTASLGTDDRLDLGYWLPAAWLLGILGFGLPILIGVMRSRRLIRSAVEVGDPRLLQHFRHAVTEVGVTARVALRMSPAVRTPMTGGVWRPVVLLPEAALQWGDDCLAAVLRHELVHVHQHDALRQLASRLSVALYWFHPLAWRAARLGALAREMACDESVLRLGTRPSRYARHLLNLADPQASQELMPALVRLDHPHLEERVMAILRASPPPVSRRVSFLATLVVAAWTVAVAAAGPAAAQDTAPTPPRAPRVAPVEHALAPPLPRLPALPARASAPEAPPLPLPMVPPLPPLPPEGADCDFDGSGYRTSGSADRNVHVRMHSTTVAGRRLCAAVRGGDAKTGAAFPTGRLPVGMEVTLAASGPDGTQRLEIVGGATGNRHTWLVDGRERPFDAAAAEWRDAMFEVLEASAQQAMIQGEAARVRGEIARAHGEVARTRGEIARVQAAEVARHARALAADAAARSEVVQRDMRVALNQQEHALVELHERLARQSAQLHEEQAALASRRAVSLGSGTRVGSARSLDADARAAERRATEVARTNERAVARIHGRLAEIDARVGAGRARAGSPVRASGVGERTRVLEERAASTDVLRRVRESEVRRLAALDVEPRVTEISPDMEPRVQRLERAIRGVRR
jgi:beta-lactamase regulating signal transducer with metallopeptidase domain